MSTVQSHIERGLIVGPVSKRPLKQSADREWLEDSQSRERYRVVNGKVPVLLADETWATQYSGEDSKMEQEYLASPSRRRWRNRLSAKAYPTSQSRKAFEHIFSGLLDCSVCLSPGGGPSREHPKLTTLNIGPFPNVDIVADAHAIPYCDESVDAIYCEAVVEHLYDPLKAAREMFRVLKPGRFAYVCTPFLQPYHGYPHHYQNYTLTGHERLFKTVGFSILESGTAVGPVFALTTMVGTFLKEYLPKPVGRICQGLWSILSVFITPFDKFIAARPNAYLMASTTYVLLHKPLN